MCDAYREGYDAFGRGAAMEENPYDEDGLKRDRWDEGWEDAKIDKDSQRRSICQERA